MMLSSVTQHTPSQGISVSPGSTFGLQQRPRRSPSYVPVVQIRPSGQQRNPSQTKCVEVSQQPSSSVHCSPWPQHPVGDEAHATAQHPSVLGRHPWPGQHVSSGVQHHLPSQISSPASVLQQPSNVAHSSPASALQQPSDTTGQTISPGQQAPRGTQEVTVFVLPFCLICLVHVRSEEGQQARLGMHSLSHRRSFGQHLPSY